MNSKVQYNLNEPMDVTTEGTGNVVIPLGRCLITRIEQLAKLADMPATDLLRDIVYKSVGSLAQNNMEQLKEAE